ncbi:MAG: transglycosylase domain-containing protein [Tissierellia bacterium]|nr:transglycosylase domain-containing protein [Tissierellia bacterium]
MTFLKNIPPKSKVKIILIALLILLTLLFSSILAGVLGILTKVPATDSENLSLSFAQTSTIYDQDGQLLENLESQEFRSLVSLDQVPDHVTWAFLSIEDRNFYKHGALDLKGILAASYDNAKEGALVRGGSTITQQLIKNVYLSPEKSFQRKIQEAYLALRLEEALSKDEILESYLNRVNLGQGAYGLQAAAQVYFSKNVEDLSLEEGALLAGVVKSPSHYQPLHRYYKGDPGLRQVDPYDIVDTTQVAGQDMVLVKNPEALKRQKLVLSAMAQEGYISQEEAKKAGQRPIYFKPLDKKPTNLSPYSLDFIEIETARILQDKYDLSFAEAENKVLTGGYHIYSSIDADLQENLEELYRHYEDFLAEKNPGYPASLLDFKTDNRGHILDHFGDKLYLNRDKILDDKGDLLLSQEEASLTEEGDLTLDLDLFHLREDDILFKDLYALDQNNTLKTYSMEGLDLRAEDYALKKDQVLISRAILEAKPDFYQADDQGQVKISRAYFELDSLPTLQPQSSAVIINNKSGAIEAIIGGLQVDSQEAKGLNRADQSTRPPGTAITPFTVYTVALEKGDTLATVYDDVPYKYQGDYWPENRDQRYRGYMTLSQALLNRVSTIPSLLVQKHGMEASLDMLERLGFYKKEGSGDFLVTPEENPDRNDFSLDALSQGNFVKGVNNVYLTNAYRTLANQGQGARPHVVDKIVDSQGQVIFTSQSLKDQEVIQADRAYLIQNLLTRNQQNKNLAPIEREEFMGQLGQTKFNTDYWLVGSIPTHSVGLWVGADSPLLFLSEDPKTVASWYNEILKLLPDGGQLPRPSSQIVQEEICKRSGLLASSYCKRAGDSGQEVFIKGTEPKKTSDVHVRRLICNESGGLATQYCPYESLVYGYYFQRPDKYKSQDHNGVYPEDMGLVPRTYCHIHTEETLNETNQDQENQDPNTNEED